MATNKMNGHGKNTAETDPEFFKLYSEALEESIRNDFEYWVEIQRKALLSTLD